MKSPMIEPLKQFDNFYIVVILFSWNRKYLLLKKLNHLRFFFRSLNIVNNTIEVIIKSLKLNRLEAARTEFHHDGDKIDHRVKLNYKIVKLLGCRLHNNINCSSWVCKSLNESF